MAAISAVISRHTYRHSVLKLALLCYFISLFLPVGEHCSNLSQAGETTLLHCRSSAGCFPYYNIGIAVLIGYLPWLVLMIGCYAFSFILFSPLMQGSLSINDFQHLFSIETAGDLSYLANFGFIYAVSLLHVGKRPSIVIMLICYVLAIGARFSVPGYGDVTRAGGAGYFCWVLAIFIAMLPSLCWLSDSNDEKTSQQVSLIKQFDRIITPGIGLVLSCIIATMTVTVIVKTAAPAVAGVMDRTPSVTHLAPMPIPPVSPKKGPEVLRWRDKSGHHQDLVNTENATEPFYLEHDAWESIPAVSFPYHGQKLATLSPFGVSGDADRTMITVQYNLVVATGVNSPGHAFGIDFAPDLNLFYLPYHWMSDNIVTDHPNMLNRWNIAVARHQSSYSSGRVDGLPVGRVQAVTLNTIAAPMTIGTRMPGDGLSRPGQLAELLYYSRSLSTNETKTIEKYLRCKWFARSSGASVTSKCSNNTFSPLHLAGLQAWFDASDSSSLVLQQ